MKELLVLGAGYIGGHLVRHFNKNGIKTTGTYYKTRRDDSVFFEAGKTALEQVLQGRDVSHVVLSFVSYKKVDEIKRNFPRCRAADLEGAVSIVDECRRKGIVPVYLSTDYVFDGTKGNYSEEDETNPINAYGYVKAELEKHMAKESNPGLVVRNGRVFGQGIGTLLTDIYDKIRLAKDGISFSSDHIFTPIFIRDLCEAVQYLIQNQNTGIFNVASSPPTTHYEIAELLNNFFGLKKTISKCSIDSIGLLETRPKNVSLDTGKFKNLTGFTEQPIAHFLDLPL